MATKYRSCDSVQRYQADELVKAGNEIKAKTNALRLSEKKGAQLDSLVVNARESSEILAKQFNQDRKALRKKVRIRNLIAGGQFVLILIILL